MAYVFRRPWSRTTQLNKRVKSLPPLAISAGTGAFTLTGQSATLIFGTKYGVKKSYGTNVSPKSGGVFRKPWMRQRHAGVFEIPSATNLSIAAQYGSFALTGQAVTFTVSQAETYGSFSLTGQPLTFTISEAPSYGSFSLTGQQVAFGDLMGEQVGTFTLTGEPLTFSISEPAVYGSFALTGQPVTYSLTFVPAYGAYTLTGIAVTETDSEAVSPGYFTLTGFDAGYLVDFNPGGTNLTNHGPTGPTFTRKRWRELQDQFEADEKARIKAEQDLRASLRAIAEKKRAEERAKKEAELQDLIAKVEAAKNAHLLQSSLKAAQATQGMQQKMAASAVDQARVRAAMVHKAMLDKHAADMQDEEDAIAALLND